MKDHILANGGQKLLSPTRRSTCRTTSDEAERFAEVRMLPALGSTGSYHARFASHRLGFDLRATHRTRRVPVDASTGASDGLVGPAEKGAVTHPGARAETHVYADI